MIIQMIVQSQVATDFKENLKTKQKAMDQINWHWNLNLLRENAQRARRDFPRLCSQIFVYFETSAHHCMITIIGHILLF